MNRREVLSAMTAMCGAVGVKARSDVVVEGEPKATLAVIHCESKLPPAGLEAIHRSWNRLREQCPDLPPCVVMDNGLKLDLVLSPDALDSLRAEWNSLYNGPPTEATL